MFLSENSKTKEEIKPKLKKMNKFLDINNISTIFIETENVDSSDDSRVSITASNINTRGKKTIDLHTYQNF